MHNKNCIEIKDIKFNIIENYHNDIITEYINNKFFPLIHQSFAYNYALNGSRNTILLKQIENCICIFKMYRNKVFLSATPLGLNKENCKYVLTCCNEIIEKVNNKKAGIIGDYFTIEDGFLDALKEVYILRPSILGKEYFYDCKEIVDMRGNRFEVFRRNIKKFNQQYDTNTYVGNEISKQELYILYEYWVKECLERKSSLSLIFDKDYYKKSVDEAHIVKQTFIQVYHKGRLIGMAGIIPINNNTCMCLNRKTVIGYSGLSEYLVYKSCEFALSKGYKYLNDSWDANHKGLIQFKDKYNPIKKVQLYQLIKN